jgi:hypothetical protein
MVRISRKWLRLSLVASGLMAIASAAGVFVPPVYAKETPSWAAQGAGQDLVNLLIAFPLLLVSTWYAGKGSVRGFSIWLGAMIYVVYSYLMSAFFVHFGPIFPIYVATVGTSAYALAGATTNVDVAQLRLHWPPSFRLRSVGIFLICIGVAFAGMWLASIARALATGAAPEGVAEIGLPVNPVHVLDLAFLLPLTILTGVAHWKRRAFGVVFATPMLVFFVLMDAAILSMTYFMWARGVSASLGIAPVMAAALAASLALSLAVMRRVRRGF